MIKRKIIARVRKDIPSYYYHYSKESRFLAVYYKDIWFDGGFSTDCRLSDKSEFYKAAGLFVKFINEIIEKNEETIVYIGTFVKEIKNYEHWVNLMEYDCFVNFAEHISNDDIKKLHIPKDKVLIDYLVENGMRYLTNTALYLPNSKIVIKPDCHTHLEIFCSDCDNFIKKMSYLFYLDDYKFLELKDVK